MNVVLVESGVESGGEGRIVVATDHPDAPAEQVVDRLGELLGELLVTRGRPRGIDLP